MVVTSGIIVLSDGYELEDYSVKTMKQKIQFQSLDLVGRIINNW